MRFGEQTPPSGKVLAWVESIKNGGHAKYDTRGYELNAALQRAFSSQESEKRVGHRPRLYSSATIADMPGINFPRPELHYYNVPRSEPIPIIRRCTPHLYKSLMLTSTSEPSRVSL